MTVVGSSQSSENGLPNVSERLCSQSRPRPRSSRLRRSMPVWSARIDEIGSCEHDVGLEAFSAEETMCTQHDSGEKEKDTVAVEKWREKIEK